MTKVITISSKRLKELQNLSLLKSAVHSARIEGNPLTVSTFLIKTLSPRRQEILNIVADHPNCSFYFLARRFAAVNPKTLHYDLKKLLDLNLIIKVGITRGALYRQA